MNRLAVSHFALALLASAAPLRAQQAATTDIPDVPRPAPIRVGHTRAKFVIDGKLDEPDWRSGEVATDFVQYRPLANRPATERTEARVILGASDLYVGFRVFDTRPDSIAAQLARRDVGGIYSDWVDVLIDSFHDRRTGFQFGVNPRGQQRDIFRFNDTEEDSQWDAVWQSAARIDSVGWTAELRIPLSQLRYDPKAAPAWGINFAREIARRGELSAWASVIPTLPGIISRESDLIDLDSLTRSSGREFIPYVRSQVATNPVVVQGGLGRAREATTALGADLRARLPKSLTLSGSVNPDFGQVEADPAVVNLSAFEIFFPERRPFFLENQDAFAFGKTRNTNDNDPPNFFYTRRIGRRPQRTPSGGDIRDVDVAVQTPILGALKVSGTTPGGWSVGAVNAVTARENARVLDTLGRVRTESAEPLTNYQVLRLRRLSKSGQSAVGAFNSSVFRDLGDTVFAPRLTRNAIVGGVDFEHAWQNRTWTVSGVLAESRVSGDARAITRLQRANYRSFQRPDATHLRFDPNRTSLRGEYAALSLFKSGGRHVTGSMVYEQTAPGFETNDIGFQFRSDFRSVSGALFYQEPTQKGAFREWSIGAFPTFSWNYAGLPIERRVSLFSRAETKGFRSLSVESYYQPRTFSDRLLRGGPIAARPEDWRVALGVGSDSRGVARINAGIEFRGDASGSRGVSPGIEVDWRAAPNIRVRASAEYGMRDYTDQYVTSVSDAAAAATYGRRYVFSDVKLREARFESRVDWTFTPRLSLQLFLQPFISSGSFISYKEFLQPNTFTFARYGAGRGTLSKANGRVTIDPDGTGGAPAFTIADQDYSARALRGNAVVRWEYSPGSTVFVVWQQQRDDEDDVARLNVLPRSVDIFRAAPRNVFLIKYARWVGR
ncbi:MAG: carbohydrate binding family 9 domain-containing protein [Gemmatimonadaceae bacterium]|nr:carbohydrate binding family 9 domain-containing protein [Gemmatimonadaceae bacterium]